MINLTCHVAILIDADNTQLGYVEQVMKLSEYYGTVNICRAYGDWKVKPLSAWHEKLAPGVEYIQVDRRGKNATDHYLLVEIGEIISPNYFREEVDILVIVSNDGDFASACQLIQERGKRVIIIGNRKKISKALRNACYKYFYLENLNDELKHLAKCHPIPPNELRQFWFILRLGWLRLYKDETHDDWITVSELDSQLREMERNYEEKFGKYGLLQWLNNFDWYLEIDIDGQRIRQNPTYARYSLLVQAYWETRKRLASYSDSVSLAQFGIVLRELSHDYESQFGNRKLSSWLKEYPDVFKITEDSVTIQSLNLNYLIPMLKQHSL